MFKKLFTIIPCLICLCFNGLFATSLTDNDDLIQYLTSEQIICTPEGIFIIVDDQSLPVRSLSYVGDGYYAPRAWTCPKCGYANKWINLKCENCGYSGF